MMGLRTCVLISFCICVSQARIRRNGVTFANNGYENILIAIHEDVAENAALVQSIQQSFTDASRFLYLATKRRAYFRHVQILVPSSWSDHGRYARAVFENYDNADILVKPASTTKRDVPFVRTYSECGETGEYMQLTDGYFLNDTASADYGPRDKLLVHEWAHLRWGVFDEYPYKRGAQFYYSPSTESVEPVKCTKSLKGLVIRSSGATFQVCRGVDPSTGRYAKGCKFYPFPTKEKNPGVVASLMDRQWVDSIEFFCDKEHNSEAPSRHNRRCGGRSTWDVITASPDFADGNNPPRPIIDSMPKYTVMRSERNASRVVLVLDESASMMDNNKMLRMVQAVTKFIRSEIKTGSYVGVVMFSASPRLLVPLTRLDTQPAREGVVTKLPLVSDGGTGIGGGVRAAATLLGTDGGTIVLVSDGEENHTPYITQVIPEVVSLNITVDCVAFTSASDGAMSKISTSTGGEFYYDSNMAQSKEIDAAFVSIANRLNGASGPSGSESQATESFSLSQRVGVGANVTKEAYLNEGLGSRTRLVITYVTTTPSFTATSPSGRVYNVTSPETMVDSRTKTINLLIPGVAETGKWTFTLSNMDAIDADTFGVSFASIPASDTDVIVLKASRSAVADAWPPRWTIRGVAQRGGLPVTGLRVTASVDRLGSSPVDIQLFDDGTGADTQQGDGVYSRFFTQFTDSGRYSISLSAVAEPGESKVMASDPAQGAAPVVDPDNPSAYASNIHESRRELQSVTINNGVSLTTSGGALELNPPKDKLTLLRQGTDIFAPARIVDLRVVATDPDVPSVTLHWTATGDDLDEGTASHYDIHVNVSGGMSRAYLIPPSDILTGNLSNPNISGHAERYVIRVAYNKTVNASYVFTVTARDKVGQMGAVSNAAAAGLGFVPPLIEETLDDITTVAVTDTTGSSRDISTTMDSATSARPSMNLTVLTTMTVLIIYRLFVSNT